MQAGAPATELHRCTEHDLILKNVFNFQSSSRNVCFPVSFANDGLEYEAVLAQSKGYFAQFSSSPAKKTVGDVQGVQAWG